MDHFDLPSPGLVFCVLFFVTILPIAVFTFVPAALFRAHFRRNRGRWARHAEHVVRAAYRGSSVEWETPSNVPITVTVASLTSLYLAVPVLLVAPLSLASLADRIRLDALAGVAGSLLMIALAIVGCAILRPSREAVLGARVVAAVEVVVALVAAWVEWAPLAVVAGAHATTLVAASVLNQRGNVHGCA